MMSECTKVAFQVAHGGKLALARHLPCFAVAAVLATGISGCGSVSEQTLASSVTSPGKYDPYTCQDLENAYNGTRVRVTELEQVMSRASQGAGGEFVNTIAYRGEYAQYRGQIAQILKAKEDKHCAVDSKFSSGRAVF
jgi:uncharacterized protein YceK